ncbi:unnamed protein product [Chondrus crispus]|uniref:Uncharacterized protein n=1 Tax=Chondrus crispus TaxID=2769 RepID=R7QC21_CHOCR|nr:unnamed protein product [Chondrus crispus]CDF36042.1 unnamed protein product [Chondrus crispus]|eukprot:XP_005715861.1 unnamed protein product [Chondrus crispus]
MLSWLIGAVLITGFSSSTLSWLIGAVLITGFSSSCLSSSEGPSVSLIDVKLLSPSVAIGKSSIPTVENEIVFERAGVAVAVATGPVNVGLNGGIVLEMLPSSSSDAGVSGTRMPSTAIGDALTSSSDSLSAKSILSVRISRLSSIAVLAMLFASEEPPACALSALTFPLESTEQHNVATSSNRRSKLLHDISKDRDFHASGLKMHSPGRRSAWGCQE